MQTLLKQGYVTPRLKSPLQNFYGRHYKLFYRYKMAKHFRYIYVGNENLIKLSLNIYDHRVINRCLIRNRNLLTLHEHLSSPSVSWWGSCCSSFAFCVLFLLCFSFFCLVSNVASISWDRNRFKIVVFLLFHLIMRIIYILSSVLWRPLPYMHKNDVRFVFIPSCM